MDIVLIFITVGKDPFIEQQVKERMCCEQYYLKREILICPVPLLVKMTALSPWNFLPRSFMKLC